MRRDATQVQGTGVGPFKCYVYAVGCGRVLHFPGKKRYEGTVQIQCYFSVVRGWARVNFPEKRIT